MRKLHAATGALAAAVIALVAFSGPVAATAPPGNPTAPPSTGDPMPWNVDAAHTEVNFKVTHFFTPVSGTFEDFEVDLMFDPQSPEDSTVWAKIAVASVDTGNQRRDDHLRSADFFDAGNHPYITFQSTSVRQVDASHFVAVGDLSIRGRTKRVELPITLLGTRQIPAEMKEMLGGIDELASFRATTTLERGDFGVGAGSWAATLVVGGDVDVEILVEANR